MEKLKRVVIKEEYMAITNDMTESIILNQFIYWSERIKDFDNFILEDRDLLLRFGTEDVKEQIPISNLKHGWIYKKANELKTELMDIVSEKTINRKLESLVEKGYLDRRNNPLIKYDRTYQYRVNLKKIMLDLLPLGYTIEGYKIPLDFLEMAISLNRQNDDCKNTDCSSIQLNSSSECKSQNDFFKRQNDAIKRRSDGAIPKITTETTTETTSSSSSKASNKDIFKSFESNICELKTTTFKSFSKLVEKYNVEFIEAIIEECTLTNVKSYKGFEAAVKNYIDANCTNSEEVHQHAKNFRKNNKSKALNKNQDNNNSNILKFKNFDERQYDYDSLEKQLLGWNED